MIGKISDILKQSGATAFGFAKATPVEERAWNEFLDWLKRRGHAGMSYMENHSAIRRDPRLLLDGAKSIISMAFPFKPAQFREKERGMIACYAYGLDYHDVIRKRLGQATEEMRKAFGGEYRICVDSAPIMERYWAVKAGIGETGDNGAVIVPGAGNMVFLAEIVTTLDIKVSDESACATSPRGDESAKKYIKLNHCLHCGKCIRQCPLRALRPDGTVDSSRCLSYLTIEHRGEWTRHEAIEAMNTDAGKNLIFGCDICLRECPLNHDTPSTVIHEFLPSREVMELTKERVAELKQEDFSRIFKGSPIKRCKLSGLKRNIGENI